MYTRLIASPPASLPNSDRPVVLPTYIGTRGTAMPSPWAGTRRMNGTSFVSRERSVFGAHAAALSNVDIDVRDAKQAAPPRGELR